MIGKSNIADCDENCKYEGLYEMYKNAHDDVRNELISQINVMVPLLFFLTCITAVCPLCCMITGKYNNDINRNITIVIIVTIAMDLISFALILPTIVEGKRFLKGCKISLSNIAANKITEHLYRIQSIEDIKNENIFTDKGRLNIRKSRLHCIDDSGNEAYVYINPNESCWFDKNDNNILSTDGVVSKLFFCDDGETSETGVMKYTVNGKTAYIEEMDESEDNRGSKK